MVMALGGRGSLFDVLRLSAVTSRQGTAAADNGGLPWLHRLSIAAGVAAGIDFLHSQKPPIVHRDLKCGNVVISESFKPQVADFGLSRSVDSIVGRKTPFASASSEGQAIIAAGTLRYLAPEILLRTAATVDGEAGAEGSQGEPTPLLLQSVDAVRARAPQLKRYCATAAWIWAKATLFCSVQL